MKTNMYKCNRQWKVGTMGPRLSGDTDRVLTLYTLYNSHIEGAGPQRVSHCGLLAISNKLAARLMFVFVGLGKRFRLHYSARHWSSYCHHEQLAVCQGMCSRSLTHASVFSSLHQTPLFFSASKACS